MSLHTLLLISTPKRLGDRRKHNCAPKIVRPKPICLRHTYMIPSVSCAWSGPKRAAHRHAIDNEFDEDNGAVSSPLFWRLVSVARVRSPRVRLFSHTRHVAPLRAHTRSRLLARANEKIARAWEDKLDIIEDDSLSLHPYPLSGSSSTICAYVRHLPGKAGATK